MWLFEFTEQEVTSPRVCSFPLKSHYSQPCVRNSLDNWISRIIAVDSAGKGNGLLMHRGCAFYNQGT